MRRNLLCLQAQGGCFLDCGMRIRWGVGALIGNFSDVGRWGDY